jgi:hypothetical protein
VGKQLTTRTKTGEYTFAKLEVILMELVKNGDLSISDIGFYFVIKCHLNRGNGLCCPSISTLVSETKTSRQTVIRIRNKLRDAGVLEWDVNGRCEYKFPFESGYHGTLPENGKDNSKKQDEKAVLGGTKIRPGGYQNKTGGGYPEKTALEQDIDSVVGTMGGYQNKTPNQSNQKNITHTGEKSVCVPSSNSLKAKTTTHQEIPQNILDDIERTIEHMRNNGGFDTSEGAFREGAMKRARKNKWELPKEKPEPKDEFLNSGPAYQEEFKFDADGNPYKLSEERKMWYREKEAYHTKLDFDEWLEKKRPKREPSKENKSDHLMEGALDALGGVQ